MIYYYETEHSLSPRKFNAPNDQVAIEYVRSTVGMGKRFYLYDEDFREVMDYNPSKACVAFLNEHRTVETKCFPFYLVCLGNFLIGFKVLSIEKTEDEAKGKLKKAGLPGMVAIIGTGNVIYSFPNEKDLIETK